MSEFLRRSFKYELRGVHDMLLIKDFEFADNVRRILFSRLLYAGKVSVPSPKSYVIREVSY